MKSFKQLRRLLLEHGYTLVMEDKSPTDSTQVYAIYRGDFRIRLRTLSGVELWASRL